MIVPIPEIRTKAQIRSASNAVQHLTMGANQLEFFGDGSAGDKAAVKRLNELADQLYQAINEAEDRRTGADGLK